MADGFKTKSEAIKFANKLKKKGYSPRINKLSKRGSKLIGGMKYMVFSK